MAVCLLIKEGCQQSHVCLVFRWSKKIIVKTVCVLLIVVVHEALFSYLLVDYEGLTHKNSKLLKSMLNKNLLENRIASEKIYFIQGKDGTRRHILTGTYKRFFPVLSKSSKSA